MGPFKGLLKVVLLLLLICCVDSGFGQLLFHGLGYIPETQRVDWSSAGLVSNVHRVADHVFDVTQEPGETLYQQFYSALDKARTYSALPFNEMSVIYFPGGEYFLDFPINFSYGDSNIVIQGDGAGGENPTVLKFQVGKDKNCIVARGYPVGDAVQLNADIPKNTHMLCLGQESPIGLQRDDWLMFWEEALPEAAGYSIGQVEQVCSVSLNQIKLKESASKDYSISNRIWVQQIRPVKNIGIENFKIVRLDEEKSTENLYDKGSNVFLLNAVNCWVCGVEFEQTCRHHIFAIYCSHIEVSGCYFHESRCYGGNSYGYGVILANNSTHCLVENNIFQKLRHAMSLSVGANCNVVAFNYSTDQYSTMALGGSEIPYPDSDICIHGRYSFANLYEYNRVVFIEADDVHGNNGPFNVFLRNMAQFQLVLCNTPEAGVMGCVIPSVTPYGSTSFSRLCYAQNFCCLADSVCWISHGEILNDSLEHCAVLKDVSYYYSERPDFFGPECDWPTIGPAAYRGGQCGDNEIPAYTRSDQSCKTFIENTTSVEGWTPSTGINETDYAQSSSDFTLQDCYPNPFNMNTVISYTLHRDMHVKVDVYNVLGQKIVSLVDENQVKGKYQTLWDGCTDTGQPVGSGVYLCRIAVAGEVETRTMMLLK